MKKKIYACLITLALSLGFLASSMSQAATINQGPLAGKQLACGYGYFGGYCGSTVGYGRYYGYGYRPMGYHRHYGYHHRCFWVPKHWRHGHLVPGHRVCRW